mmetsp:Transcript_12600/g.25363  ORF Transcript_12600/g.25363 Transcript_12600/m.25363 type:complete len:100 (-) Transcript_12600:481-780(-)
MCTIQLDAQLNYSSTVGSLLARWHDFAVMQCLDDSMPGLMARCQRHVVTAPRCPDGRLDGKTSMVPSMARCQGSDELYQQRPSSFLAFEHELRASCGVR